VKVIFLEDVSGVARAGQTREVANGYARNYLLPRKLAVQATSQASTQLEAQLKKIVRRQALEDAEMAELSAKLDGTEITIKAKVGEKERLYGSVTGADIARSLSDIVEREIDKRKIELSEPIRQVGVHDVTVKLTHEAVAAIKVNVISDAVTEEAKEEAVEEIQEPEAAAVEAEAAEEEAATEKEEEAGTEEKPKKKVKAKLAEKAKAKREKREKAAEAQEAEAVVEEPKAEETQEEEKPEQAEEKEQESGE
jgi:large subunit ribosomal protein L9